MRSVSKEILDETTDCEYQFACLEGNSYALCETDFALGHSFAFLKSSLEKPSCRYYFDFGNSGVCRCPVRIELFIQHNI